ncbi:hypothetical protein AM1BK_31250 [Neobacillus kokaensis]|uniref:Phage tail protein n=1 Tax=Neobacillus kokaensis TaxID=2759023 RepID=A0ABQ3N7V9_9BACI|nr:hypothetical protein AM1BK_31250 [Neobacillus kokaensis]
MANTPIKSLEKPEYKTISTGVLLDGAKVLSGDFLSIPVEYQPINKDDFEVPQYSDEE